MATVILYDVEEIPITEWARNHCLSFVGWMIYENEATIGWIDDDPDWWARYEFEFTNEQEALIFQLRWQGQSRAT
jgi:hypothetical protein